jgi:hypothetical protein
MEVIMTDEWESDWEKLFAKCSFDQDYRRQLGEALGRRDDNRIKELLGGIQVQGRDPDQLDARVSALKKAYGPMADVAAVFDDVHRFAP